MEKVFKLKRVYIRIISILYFLSFCGFVVMPTAYNIMGKDVSAKENKEEVPEEDLANTDPMNVFDYAGNDYLVKNEDEEINKLIADYYSCVIEVNMDKLETLVSDINMVDQNKLLAQNSYIEDVRNIKCYTIKGLVDGAYRVYVYYDMKLSGIDTPAPALSAFYVTMGSDGRYVIYLSGLDAEAQSFIDGADASKDVAALMDLVNKRFEKVIVTDEKLKAFCDMINQK